MEWKELKRKCDEFGLAVAACTAIDCRYAVMTRIRVGGQWTWATWICFPSQAEAAAHAREGDKVVRFRSAEWQELRRETTVGAPNHISADNLSLPDQDQTLIETVLRLLKAVESDLGLVSGEEQKRINSEGRQQGEDDRNYA